MAHSLIRLGLIGAGLAGARVASKKASPALRHIETQLRQRAFKEPLSTRASVTRAALGHRGADMVRGGRVALDAAGQAPMVVAGGAARAAIFAVAGGHAAARSAARRSGKALRAADAALNNRFGTNYQVGKLAGVMLAARARSATIMGAERVKARLSDAQRALIRSRATAKRNATVKRNRGY